MSGYTRSHTSVRHTLRYIPHPQDTWFVQEAVRRDDVCRGVLKDRREGVREIQPRRDEHDPGWQGQLHVADETHERQCKATPCAVTSYDHPPGIDRLVFGSRRRPYEVEVRCEGVLQGAREWVSGVGRGRRVSSASFQGPTVPHPCSLTGAPVCT